MGDLALTPREDFETAMTRLEQETALLIKPSKVLRAAAELLEKGWCQGQLGMRNLYPLHTAEFRPGAEIDQLCLTGAILKAVVDLTGEAWPDVNDGLTPAQVAMKVSYSRADRAITCQIPATHGGYVVPASWNDRAGRTQAEVVALVQRVAALEEEAGR